MADLPEGVALPADGSLPDPEVSAGFSAYVHVPFCTVRCGYCDFNTYTSESFGAGAARADYHESVAREIAASHEVLSKTSNPGPLRSVFFGGGTPTLLAANQLAQILGELKAQFSLVADAEVTTEVNPESVDQFALESLREVGFTRLSFGMQSAVPSVLQTLDRVHTQGQVERVVRWADELGFATSVDLIYGAPGESLDQWRTSLDAALALETNHISCYALTIEQGTKMGAALARGEIAAPDGDDLADKYLLADELLMQAGYDWYEISNWARRNADPTVDNRCQHNMYYWRNENWWGYGPGAHSHINGTRFWNVKHPLAYAQRLQQGRTPVHGSETLGEHERAEEEIMLGLRLAEGLNKPSYVREETIAQLRREGLLVQAGSDVHKLILTREGRLLADYVTRKLWEDLDGAA